MAGGQCNGMGSVALSLAPTWRSFKEGAVAPAWTWPVHGASSAPTAALASQGPQDRTYPQERYRLLPSSPSHRE